MKYFIKKIYLFLFLLNFLFFSTETFGKGNEIKYLKDNIFNYFSGSLSINKDNNVKAYNYLSKAKSLKNLHSNFNVKFLHTLILLEKFEQAFAFSKSVWREDIFLFEIDLLLGLEAFIRNDYINSEKHFQRINKVPENNLLSEIFFKNFLISWVRASENKKKESFEFLDKIPERYNSLKKLQNIFLYCYFDDLETESAFDILVNDENSNFSRYNFFFANYLLHKNKNLKARNVIVSGRKIHDSNLLIKQAEKFILSGDNKKIKNIFNCKNPRDAIAEIFYVMANLHSTQTDYKLSNFYLQISLFLNKKFLPNKTLLAENFLKQKKYDLSKNIYNSIKSVGSVYAWYSSLNQAIILSETKDTDYSISKLKKEFELLSNPDFQHYFELANFFKDNEIYIESIKYYSLALKNIDQNHFLVPKILERRGSSYERLDEWTKAERDLTESLKILPDQPYVLNYLAYSWIEKRINIDQSLKMLERANKLEENDGYIMDSLGWAHYLNKNYFDAKKFLQKAVEIMPLDPIINDHYADVLWVLNKEIQARYVWKYVLGLNSIEEKLKNKIEKKLIFGINQKL